MQKLSLARHTHVRSMLVRLMLSAATILLVTCVPAAAQSDWQLFGGVSYIRSEITPYLEPFGLDNIDAIGWGASITNYTSLRWLGATADVSGVYKNPIITIPADFLGPGVPETDTEFTNLIYTPTYTAMFGPSFAYRNNPNIEPFAHVLLGAVYREASLTSKGETLLGAPLSDAEWVFGYGLGGGVDIKISKLLALRGQVDWIRSTFSDLDTDRQNNFKVMGGLVFRISE